MSKIIFIVQEDEFNEDGVYTAPQYTKIVHDTDKSPTWPDVLETFKRVLSAAGYLGHERRIDVVSYHEDRRRRNEIEYGLVDAVDAEVVSG